MESTAPHDAPPVVVREHVSPEYPNDLYYAHLSLYAFALRWARGARVLDAGCGAGYGAAYLADHGAASVDAIDCDDVAVADARRAFPRPHLVFHRMDIQAASALPADAFDLVVCSNALEHVADAPAALAHLWRVLAEGGVLVLAVPPVVDAAARDAELLNPYHLNIWSPAIWAAVLSRYFAEVRSFTHLPRPGLVADFHNTPADTTITEADFVFDAVPEGARLPMTLTALFTARVPLPRASLPPSDWVVPLDDRSITRPPAPKPERRAAPLPAAVLAPGRPLRELPARAVAVLWGAGPLALTTEIRRYLVWQMQRRRARRILSEALRRRSGL